MVPAGNTAKSLSLVSHTTKIIHHHHHHHQWLKVNYLLEVAVALRQLNPIHKKRSQKVCFFKISSFYIYVSKIRIR